MKIFLLVSNFSPIGDLVERVYGTDIQQTTSVNCEVKEKYKNFIYTAKYVCGS